MAESNQDQQRECRSQEMLAKMVRDLQSNTSLCCVNDYHGVTLDDLNRYVRANGPLLHLIVGPQEVFFIDKDKFVPHQSGGFSINRSVSMVVIGAQLRIWALGGSHNGGGKALVAGRFMIDDTMIWMPSIAYNPSQAQRNSKTDESHAVVSDAHQMPWTFEGKPFAPTLVAKVATLVASEDGQHSHLEALDRRMRHEFVAHGVQLSWFITAALLVTLVLVHEFVFRIVCRVENSAWRDLDGGAVLPGFKVFARYLDAVLAGRAVELSSREEFDVICFYPECSERLRMCGQAAAHMEWHRIVTAIAHLREEEQQETSGASFRG